MTSKFDEIRPYDDEDLNSVIPRLLANTQLIDSLTDFRFSAYPHFVKSMLRGLVKYKISKKARSFSKVRDFQVAIEPYMKHMLKNTSDGLSVSGLDTLDLSSPCLFISNHRDIALDPAFVNWALHINQQDTVRIAVGDNLLHTDWVADLIRLNKCFVVQRSVEGRRQKLAAAKLLSEYIYHSLKHDRQHIWIAQREGRAKDGIDVTNPAILSMLAMNKPKEIPFSEYMTSLRIVPVSISYEFDPCDLRKSRALYQSQQQGSYDKPDNEDINSIITGIKGEKGRVHVHFGEVLKVNVESTNALAECIDEHILKSCRHFPTSEVALAMLSDESEKSDQRATSQQNERAKQYLEGRLSELSSAEQTILLSMYANPILRAKNRV